MRRGEREKGREGKGRKGKEKNSQLRTILIEAGDQQGDAKGSAHDTLLALGALAEAQGEVADGLGAALDAEGLVVVEGVVLALDAGVLDHGARVRLQARHGAADVPVYLHDLFHR